MISAEALATVDEKYPYGKIKLIKNTLIAFLLILGLGVGVFLVDFVTDIQFSLDIQEMATTDFSSEMEDCRNNIEKLNYEFNITQNCFQPGSNQIEIFRCMNYLNKLQQEANMCFNRGQHFQNQDEFQYMRDNLISL